MSEQFQLRRGLKSENDAFTGQPGEMSVVIDPSPSVFTALRIHDRITLGGVELARADLENVSDGSFNGLGALANSLVQGAVGVNLIKFDSSGIAVFESELSGTLIQSGTLPFNRLISSFTNAILRFDSSGNLEPQEQIVTLNIDDDAVTTSKIRDNIIPNEKIAPLAITSLKIVDDSITTNRLASNAAESSHFIDESVSLNKFANNNITAAKLLSPIINSNIVDATIGKSKLSSGIITGGKLDLWQTGNALGKRFIQEDVPLNVQGNNGDIAYITTLATIDLPPPPLPPSPPADIPPSVSITFDGVGRLTKPAEAGPEVATDSGKFTVSWWTKFDANINSPFFQLISRIGSEDSSVISWQNKNGNQVSYSMVNNNVIRANSGWKPPIILGRWHHCLLQHDLNAPVSDASRRETLRFFFDGVELVSELGPASGPGSDKIGTDRTSFLNFSQIVMDSGLTFTTSVPGKTAEWYLIDGQILPSTEFVTNGSPKLYTGTFGNQGYHLDFKDTGDLGKDISGNNKHWTTVGTVSPNPDGPPSPPLTDDLVSAWFDGVEGQDNLVRTMSVAGDQTEWLYSTWVQRNGLGTLDCFFSGGDSLLSNTTFMRFDTSDRLEISTLDGVGFRYVTAARFRDIAWYHIVVSYDSDNTIPGERLQLYVNGNRITDFDIKTDVNPIGFTTEINKLSTRHRVGSMFATLSTQNFNGYISQAAFIDGKSIQQQDFNINSFGSRTNVGQNAKTAIWTSKKDAQITAIVNTGGVNSFLLAREIGDGLDSSNKGNNFTPSSMNHNLNGSLNGPSNLYMIFNLLQNHSWSFLEGNKICTGTANVIENYQALGNIYARSGKYHIEFEILGTGAFNNGYGVGISPRVASSQGASLSGHTTQGFGQVMYDSELGIVDASDGVLQFNTVATYTNGDRITMDVDFDNNVVNFFKNGIGIASVTPKREINLDDYTIIVGDRSAAAVDIRYQINSEPSEFVDTPLTGFIPWNTRNVGTPQFQGIDFFNAIAYTGNGVESTGTPIVTLDPNDLIPQAILSNGNLTVNFTGIRQFSGTFSLGSVDAGDSNGFYVEFTLDSTSIPTGGLVGIGFVNIAHDSSSSLNNTSNTIIYTDQGDNRTNGQVFPGSGDTWNPGDTIGAFVKENTVEFFKNGVSQFIGATIIGGVRFTVFYSSSTSETVVGTVNFGNTPFVNTPPTGAQNMPAIITGGQTIQRVGFQPDFTWIKGRNQSFGHLMTDVVRGPTRSVSSNTEAGGNTAKPENILNDGLVSFISDGFIVGDNTSINSFNNRFISWNWKASGIIEINTGGSITSSVSVATSNHFSIVSYTGNGIDATVGHGLGGRPDLLLVKDRDSTESWGVWHKDLNATQFLKLDTTDSVQTDANIWNSLIPTATVFNIGSGSSITNTNGNEYIAYAFRSIPGVCKIGSYRGNGNVSKAPFVYTGFKPRWIMYKKMTSSPTTAWIIIDTERDKINPNATRLAPNNTLIEENNSVETDILANGFRLRTLGDFVNTNNADYLFMAFAEVAGNGTLPPIPGVVGGSAYSCVEQLVQNPTGFSTWDGAVSFFIFTGQHSALSQVSGTNARAYIRKIDDVIRGDFEVTFTVSGHSSQSNPSGFVGVYDAAKDAQFKPSNGGNNFGGGFFGSAPAHGSAPGNIAFGIFRGPTTISSVSNQFTDDGPNTSIPSGPPTEEIMIRRVAGVTTLHRAGVLFHTFNQNFSGDMRLFFGGNGDGRLFPVANLRVCSI